MKKLSLALLVAFAASSSAAFAVESNYSVGLERYTELYEEFVPSEGKVMQEDADMRGIVGGLTLTLESGNQIAISARYAKGDSDYTGSYMGGSYGDAFLTDIDRTSYELGVSFKSTFAALGDTTLSAGLGHRYLEDELDKYAGGYRRENRLHFVTLGAERKFAVGSGWSLTPKAQYKYLLHGEQRSEVEGTITNNQNHGRGFDLAVDVSHQFGAVALTVTPYLRTWDIQKSDLFAGGYYEPENQTKEAGFSVSARF